MRMKARAILPCAILALCLGASTVASADAIWDSEFDCDGDPHFPLDGPTLKFEPDESSCELGEYGWMHVCYFSLFPPTEPQVFEDHLGIKFALNVVTGDLTGVLHYCDCDISPVETSAWGTIKALYR